METIPQNQHLSEELIEQYVQGRLPASQAADISGHLFECDQCYERYELATDFQIAFREAVTPVPATAEKRESWWNLFAWPAPVWAATAAALVLMFAVIPMFRQPGAPIVAELSAVRGGEIVRVKAGHALQLRLDTTGVEPLAKVRTEIVDNSGKKIWLGESTLLNRQWEAFVPLELKKGRYWVRVYGPAGGDPIREYPLAVE